LILRFIFIICFYATFLNQQILAQVNENASEELFVKQIRISGNKQIGSSTLFSILKTKTNREFLNIPNFRPWYWLWFVSKSIGEAPYPLNREVVGRDIERLKAYYDAQGFLDSSIDTTIFKYNKTDLEISFLIKEGEQSEIRTIAYSGLTTFKSVEQRDDFLLESPLTNKKLSDSVFSSNVLFNFEKIGFERDRIIDYLRDKGYASVTKDSVRFLIKRDTLNKTQLDILIRVNQGRVYTFGDVNIFLSGPNGLPDYPEKLTVSNPEYTIDSAKIVIEKSPLAGTDFTVLYSKLFFKPGERFNNTKYIRSINNLQNLGIANLRRFALSKSGGLPDYSNLILPVFIDMQALPRNTMNVNVFGFQRFGLGAGAGLTFINRNLFGSAEQLQFGVKGSFEYAQSDNQQKLLLSSEATIGYAVPGLSFPFYSLNRKPIFENSRTFYQIRYSRLNQFNFDIKANIGFNLKYESNHKSSLTSTLDLVEIDLVDAQATDAFETDVQENTNLTPLQKELILQDFRPQINSQIRYGIRHVNTDIVKHDKGFYWEASFEVGGTIPFLIDRFIASPDTVYNTIPSLDDIKLRYEQFFKFSFDFRRYIPFSDKSIFMYRLFSGYALPFGNSTSIPLVRRFFAGGAADIRGWAPATLGPGPIQDNVSQTNGGEIKLAGFAELRQEVISNFLASDWSLAFFVDSGNIWNGSNNPNPETHFAFDSFYNEIAVGSGFGLRLDFNYLVARIDLAFRVKEPTTTSWMRDKQLYWFFGIGHSF